MSDDVEPSTYIEKQAEAFWGAYLQRTHGNVSNNKDADAKDADAKDADAKAAAARHMPVSSEMLSQLSKQAREEIRQRQLETKHDIPHQVIARINELLLDAARRGHFHTYFYWADVAGSRSPGVAGDTRTRMEALKKLYADYNVQWLSQRHGLLITFRWPQ